MPLKNRAGSKLVVVHPGFAMTALTVPIATNFAVGHKEARRQRQPIDNTETRQLLRLLGTMPGPDVIDDKCIEALVNIDQTVPVMPAASHAAKKPLPM